MKSLVVTLGLLAAINLATCTSDSTQYIRYLKERNQMERLRSQFEEICPGKDEELDEAIIQLKDCVDEIDENTETACSAVKNHFLRCSKPFVELMDSCAPEESKGVPNLVFQAVSSGVNYLCKSDGEHIFELANACLFKPDYRSARCQRRIRTKLQQYKNKPPTKSELCDLVHSMKPCLQSHLQSSCGHRITRESFLGMFDALTAPCNNTGDKQIDYNVVNEVEILE